MTYSLKPYSKNAFEEIASGFHEVSEKDLEHFRYLKEYFGQVSPEKQPKVIVIEHAYLSASYKKDYALFYALSFKPSEKFCKRLHLFSKSFSEAEFELLLTEGSENGGLTEAELQDNYLGYLVLRPLAGRVLGASILQPIQNSLENRYQLPATKPYTINLFGLQFHLKSIVFQSQDEVVSSCSTIALWTAFSVTSDLFRTRRMAPSEITIAANALYPYEGRTLPTKGLDPLQVCHAIRSIGLETEMRNSGTIEHNHILKAFMYSYLSFGIPVLLGIKLKNGSNPDFNHHLITINGYKERTAESLIEDPILRDENNFKLKGFAISEFVVHDDERGPFTELKIGEGGMLTRLGYNHFADQVQEMVQFVFVPVTPIIRVRFEWVHSFTKRFGQVSEYLEQYTGPTFWDIQLMWGVEYKRSVRKQFDKENLKSIKRDLLLKHLPKYIWVSRLFKGDEIMMDLIVDPSDDSMHTFCIHVVIWSEKIGAVLYKDFTEEKLEIFLARHVELEKNAIELLKEATLFWASHSPGEKVSDH